MGCCVLVLLSSCCGAGTAADTEMTTEIISSNLELHSLSTGRLPRVATANRMLKQMLFRYVPQAGFLYTMRTMIFCQTDKKLLMDKITSKINI